MYLLLRRNYLVLTCSQSTLDEWVAIDLESGEKEHVRWLGYCARDSIIYGAKPCYIYCNGWRLSFEDSWSYLSMGELIAGRLTKAGVYALWDLGQPIICHKPDN